MAMPVSVPAASGQRKFYTVEASDLEPIFNEFLEHLYQSDDDQGAAADAAAAAAAATGDGPAPDPGSGGVTGTGSVVTGGFRGGRADIWHKHNAIFVLNPSKVGSNRFASCR